MRGWDVEHCSIPPTLLSAPANGNRKSLSESEHQPSAQGTNYPVFRISKKLFVSDLITVNMWLVTSFVIEVLSIERDL